MAPLDKPPPTDFWSPGISQARDYDGATITLVKFNIVTKNGRVDGAARYFSASCRFLCAWCFMRAGQCKQ